MRDGRHIDVFRCPNGHAFLHDHGTCPACGGPLRRGRANASARILTNTTVRVTPDGRPVQLGVAALPIGAKTLCVIVGRVRGNGRDPVRLVKRGDRYVALASGARRAATDDH